MPFANGEFALELIPDGDSFKVAAAGLARSLAFRDAADLVRSLPEAEKGYELVRTPGGMQTVWMLTEAGFYRALGQRQAARITDERQRAVVERFQAWVYGEVLPSIRKTGAYVNAPSPQFEIPSTFAEALELAARQARKLEEAEDRAAFAEHQMLEMAPAARMADELMDAAGDYSVREAAQILSRDPRIDTGQGRLFRYLREIGWLDSSNTPYQRHVDCGRIVLRISSYEHPNRDELVATQQARITAKGLGELHRLLGGSAQFPALMSEEVAA